MIQKTEKTDLKSKPIMVYPCAPTELTKSAEDESAFIIANTYTTHDRIARPA
jgi:hypothetical protein